MVGLSARGGTLPVCSTTYLRPDPGRSRADLGRLGVLVVGVGGRGLQRRRVGVRLLVRVAEEGAPVRVLLAEDHRRAEVRHELLVALEARVAEAKRLDLHVADLGTPEVLLHHGVEGQDVRRGVQVHEGEAGGDVAVLFAGHVEEGVAVREPALLQQLQEVLARALADKVAHHHGRPEVLARGDLLGLHVVLGEVLAGDLRADRAVHALRLLARRGGHRDRLLQSREVALRRRPTSLRVEVGRGR
mmetsp:Transcript_44521/g.131917  ORF Transcript_44521/g.131917 Transcript_44521/m.131917 type:complete len:245 (-) Transcript_44521:732-1466(-)